MRARAAGFILLPVVLLLSLLAAIAFLINRDSGMHAEMVADTGDADAARYAAEAGLRHVNYMMQQKGCSGPFSPVVNNSFAGGSYWAYADQSSGSPRTVTSNGSYKSTNRTLTRANVYVYQATPQTYTFQPGTSGKDTFLDTSQPNTNSGKQNTIRVWTGKYAALIEFDLTILPAGSRVTSAQLVLLQNQGSTASGGSIGIYRVTSSWAQGSGTGGGGSPDGATWNTRDGTISWVTPGGDYTPSAVASSVVQGGTGTRSWDVTDLVASWVSGTQPNYGLMMGAIGDVNNVQLASSETNQVSDRPKLTVTYLLPCGVSPPPPPPTTVTLAPTADVDIDSPAPTTNYGADPQLYLSQSYVARVLVAFDASGIPTAAKIQSATLSFNLGASSPSATGQSLTLEVHALTQSWSESGATWKRRLPSTNWTSAGGTYTSTAYATTSLPAGFTPGNWIDFDVKSLVQGWVDGSIANNGCIVVIKTVSADLLMLNSREAASNPPKLVVTY